MALVVITFGSNLYSRGGSEDANKWLADWERISSIKFRALDCAISRSFVSVNGRASLRRRGEVVTAMRVVLRNEQRKATGLGRRVSTRPRGQLPWRQHQAWLQLERMVHHRLEQLQHWHCLQR